MACARGVRIAPGSSCLPGDGVVTPLWHTSVQIRGSREEALHDVQETAFRLDGHHGIDGAARNDHGLSAGAHGVHRDRLRCNSAQRIRSVPTLSRCCIVVIVTAIALAGCFTAVAQEPPGGVRQLVPSLAGDGVDRQAVTSALGRPWRSFEGGRICVYRIMRTTDGVSVATPDERVFAYSSDIGRTTSLTLWTIYGAVRGSQETIDRTRIESMFDEHGVVRSSHTERTSSDRPERRE